MATETPLPNPYTADGSKPRKKSTIKERIIRLWKGGERRRAYDLFITSKLPEKEAPEVIDACPEWHETVANY